MEKSKWISLKIKVFPQATLLRLHSFLNTRWVTLLTKPVKASLDLTLCFQEPILSSDGRL